MRLFTPRAEMALVALLSTILLGRIAPQIKLAVVT
jgi:hypothetical protein